MHYRVNLTFKNRGGSVEHYYHFTLGYLVPLLNSFEEIGEVNAARRVYLRSCVLFDPLLRELGLPGPRILPRRLHKWLGRFLGVLPASLSFRCFTIRGFDAPSAYDLRVFRNVSKLLREKLREKIDRAAEAISWPEGGAVPRVVLIDRAAPNPYYLSAAKKGRTTGAGSSRRSIANFEAVAEALRLSGASPRVETLEGKSLDFQIALFQSADIVVAQHGAALCNMLWARPSTAIVEILPQGPEITRPLNHFSELAGCLGLAYRSVGQNGPHGAVDVTLVTAALRELIEAMPTKAKTSSISSGHHVSQQGQ
jgi:hypothetical protein